MNTIFKLVSTAAITLSASMAIAQQNDHNAHHAAATKLAQSSVATAAPSESSAQMSEGEIRKVDKEAKKITIRHGELKNLDMPPMTMVFQVKDPALLDNVKQGDKVSFVAEKLGGRYTVTRLEAKN